MSAYSFGVSLLAAPVIEPMLMPDELAVLFALTVLNWLMHLLAFEPLYNLFVLAPDGTLLADSHAGSRVVGRNYRDRDYAWPLRGPAGPGGVYVSRVSPHVSRGSIWAWDGGIRW